MSSTITRFESTELSEIFIDNSTGEAFTSVSGYARLVGKDRTAISHRITRANLELKTVEVPTTTGFKPATLITENLILEWLSKDSPQLLLKFAQAGVRLYLHKLAGYEHKKPLSQAEALLESVAMLVAQEKRLANLEAEVKAVSSEIDRTAGLCSIMGYAVRLNKKIPLVTAANLGRQATAICKSRGIEVQKVNDPRFGKVGVYPESILSFLFNQL